MNEEKKNDSPGIWVGEYCKGGEKTSTVIVSFEVPSDSYRINKDDYVYYNSDLNKFIGKECERVMTSIDCDLMQFKKKKKILRIAEYKHNGENLGYQQNDLLKELAKAFDFLNKQNYPIHFEVCLIRGNYPFVRIEVTDFIKNSTITIEGEDVKKYLTIEL